MTKLIARSTIQDVNKSNETKSALPRNKSKKWNWNSLGFEATTIPTLSVHMLVFTYTKQKKQDPVVVVFV